jgi:hypothetical protein
MYYLANLRVLNDIEKSLYSTDVVLVYGKTVTDAMAAIVRQYGDEMINDVRIVPLYDYESFDDVLLIEEDIDKSNSLYLSSTKTAITISPS